MQALEIDWSPAPHIEIRKNGARHTPVPPISLKRENVDAPPLFAFLMGVHVFRGSAG
jgi:hypothetical protein